MADRRLRLLRAAPPPGSNTDDARLADTYPRGGVPREPAAPRAPRVLLLERQESLRHALRDLLRRKGFDVTADAPDGVDLFGGGQHWDAVVFNASQRPIRRQRWLFGYRPARGKTRLVALCGENDAASEGPPEPPPTFARHEVDATLPYPLSVSTLVNAILGQEPRVSSRGGARRSLAAFRDSDTNPGLPRRARRSEPARG